MPFLMEGVVMGVLEGLLEVADRLMGPGGCPWDQKQTFKSLQPFVIEEAHEVVEAVDLDEDSHMIEELGDLLYVIVFYAKLAKVHGRFGMEEVVKAVTEKLIRRHPHVFGGVKADTLEEIKENWERIKKEEGKKEEREFPPTLPLLVRAQKVLEKLERGGKRFSGASSKKLSEDEVGDELVSLIEAARRSEVDVESALRRALHRLERD